VTFPDLVEAAAAVRGKGAARARHVAAHASGLAANPFESMLRAIAIEVGLSVQPLDRVEVHLAPGDAPRRLRSLVPCLVAGGGAPRGERRLKRHIPIARQCDRLVIGT
jgi:hypothetical protein